MIYILFYYTIIIIIIIIYKLGKTQKKIFFK